MPIQNNDQKLILLGHCGKPHGIAGGFSARLFNTEDSAVKRGVSLVLKPKGPDSSLPPEGRECEVKKANVGNKTILFFEGVETRNEAEAMAPFDLYIKRSQLPALRKGEYYLEDLVGLRVVGPNKEELGSVESYFDNGAQAVLVIKRKSGKTELPFVESFFPHVDLENGLIVMNEPEIV